MMLISFFFNNHGGGIWFLLKPHMSFWYSSVRKMYSKFTNILYKVKCFQLLMDTSEPLGEDNAISHNILWYKIRLHKWRTDASSCIPIKDSIFMIHSSFISYLECHYTTAVLNINFPALWRRPSFLIVTLTTSRPFRSKQLILPRFTLLGKNNMLSQERIEEMLSKNLNTITHNSQIHKAILLLTL